MLEKIPDQDLNVWSFSNPGDKVQILVEIMGLICPVVLHLLWTLSPEFENNYTFKCWSGIFSTILTYTIMVENCQNSIPVYGCSPIQGTQFYSCWNLMKPGSQIGTYARIKRWHTPHLHPLPHLKNILNLTQTQF